MTTARSWPELDLYLKTIEQTHERFDWIVCRNLSFLLTSLRPYEIYVNEILENTRSHYNHMRNYTFY